MTWAEWPAKDDNLAEDVGHLFVIASKTGRRIPLSAAEKRQTAKKSRSLTAPRVRAPKEMVAHFTHFCMAYIIASFAKYISRRKPSIYALYLSDY